MRLILILSVVGLVILGIVAYKQNKALKNADTYIGDTLNKDYRTTPKV